MADRGLDVTGEQSVTFKVKACHDAHAALSQNKGVDSILTYEIAIGGWGNKKSAIRKKKQGDNLSIIDHSPVDCNNYKEFWISWINGVISVGYGLTVGINRFLFLNDRNPHPVNYVAFSTGWGSSGKWKFPIGNA